MEDSYNPLGQDGYYEKALGACLELAMDEFKKANATSGATDSTPSTQVDLIPIREGSKRLTSTWGMDCSAVTLNFEGAISGLAAIVLTDKMALNIAAKSTGLDPSDPALLECKADAIREFGNIVVNRVVGSISNQLGTLVKFSNLKISPDPDEVSDEEVIVYTENVIKTIFQFTKTITTDLVYWARRTIEIPIIQSNIDLLILFDDTPEFRAKVMEISMNASDLWEDE
ncbi:hypothetical protein WDW37_20210 [Bdellovibrionota bacterium FG-1]